MVIISDTETCAIHLENSSKETDAVCLRQNVSHILNRNLNIKLQDNLSKPQRKTSVQMKNNKDTTIYPFDKASEFVVYSKKNAMQKIEEQLGKGKIAENDPTMKFTIKIQKILCRLRKEKSLQTQNISKYIPQILYDRHFVVKTGEELSHENYCVNHGNTRIWNIQLPCRNNSTTLNKNNNKIQNSTSFVHETKDGKIQPTEIQVSYNVVNLYSSDLFKSLLSFSKMTMPN